MKKIFTLATMFLLTVSLFAAAPHAKLTISNNSKLKVTVSVDGQYYIADKGAGNGTDIIINDLRAGIHSVKIYQQENRQNIWQNLFDKGRDQLIYSGSVTVKAHYRTDITISKTSRVSINEQLVRKGWDDRKDWNTVYRQAMDAGSFDQLKYLINRASYDNDKLNVAKQAISANYFSSAQIKDMMLLFGFESSKLEIAKYSYTYTLDKENYFIVNEALWYNSSKTDLARFIQQTR